jgi:hypothetical protein
MLSMIDWGCAWLLAPSSMYTVVVPSLGYMHSTNGYRACPGYDATATSRVPEVLGEGAG